MSIYYPAIRSTGLDTQFTVSFLCVFVFMCGYGFLSRGFTDWHDILHGGLATSQTGVLLFFFGGGYSPRDGRTVGVNWAPYGGICFLLKHL